MDKKELLEKLFGMVNKKGFTEEELVKILDDYKDKKISWFGYEKEFLALIKERNIIRDFEIKYKNYDNI